VYFIDFILAQSSTGDVPQNGISPHAALTNALTTGFDVEYALM